MLRAREQTDTPIFKIRDAQDFKHRRKCLILCVSINPSQGEGCHPTARVPPSSPVGQAGGPSPANRLRGQLSRGGQEGWEPVSEQSLLSREPPPSPCAGGCGNSSSKPGASAGSVPSGSVRPPAPTTAAVSFIHVCTHLSPGKTGRGEGGWEDPESKFQYRHIHHRALKC